MPASSTRTAARALRGLTSDGLLRSSGWLLIGATLSRGATLAASIAVARIIAPADFGKLTLMQTGVALLGGLGGLGLALAVTRQVAESRTADPRTAGGYIGTALLLTLTGGLVITAAFVGARTFFAGLLLHDQALTMFITASAAAVLFTALTSAIQGALTGLEAFRSLAVAQWVQGGSSAIGLVAGAAAGGASGSLLGLSAGLAIATVASYALLLSEAAKQGVTISYRPERRGLASLWRIGLPAFGAFIAVTVALLGSQLILSRRAGGYSEVALFGNAYRWHLVIVFIPASVSPLLVPVMTRLASQERADRVATIFSGSMWATFGLAVVPAAIVAAGAPLLLPLSGAFYARHALPLIIMAAAAVPSALNNVLSSTSVSLGAMREWLFSDVVLAAVLIGAAFVLVAGMKANGLALAFLAAYIATDVALVVPLRRRLHVIRA